MSGRDVRPGHLHIKNTAGPLPGSSEGLAHGRVCQDLLQLSLLQVSRKGGVIIGFSIVKGKFRIDLVSCSGTEGRWGRSAQLTRPEAIFIERMVELWKQKGQGFTKYVRDLAEKVK